MSSHVVFALIGGMLLTCAAVFLWIGDNDRHTVRLPPAPPIDVASAEHVPREHEVPPPPDVCCLETTVLDQPCESCVAASRLSEPTPLKQLPDEQPVSQESESALFRVKISGWTVNEHRHAVPRANVKVIANYRVVIDGKQPSSAAHKSKWLNNAAVSDVGGAYELDLELPDQPPVEELTLTVIGEEQGYISSLPIRFENVARDADLHAEPVLWIGGSLIGRVLDPAGLPVPGLNITMYRMEEDGFGGLRRVDAMGAHTNEAGEFAIKRLRPGAWRAGDVQSSVLRVVKDSRFWQVQSSAAMDIGDVRLDHRTCVKIRVMAAAGKHLPSVTDS